MAAVVVLLAAFALQAITSMVRKCPTSDENVHLSAGYTHLVTGDFRLNPEDPPLVKSLAALPLLATDINGGFDHISWQLEKEKYRGETAKEFENKKWIYGWWFLYRWNDAKTLIFWARMVMVAMSVGAGLLVFFWARELYGNAAGLFALLLFCFSPNILAHGRLVNSDMGLAFFSLLALYCLDRALRRMTPLRVVLAGITLGLALLSKYTALIILPAFLILIAIRIVQKTPLKAPLLKRAELVKRRSRILPAAAVCIAILLITWGVIWAGYGFRFRGIDPENEKVQQYLAAQLPLWESTHAPYEFAMESKLLPQAFLYGFQYNTFSTSRRAAFLDGEYSTTGWWYYFIMTLLYKTPVPTLIFLALSLLLSYRLSRGRWYYETPLIVFFIVFYGTALAGKINIGHRHILPVLPVIFIFVSKLVNHIQRPKVSQTAILATIFGLLIVWYVLGTALIWPDYLAYFNEPSGGPDNGYRHLTDSNIEWGQDLIQLKEFMDAHNIKRVHLAYFGQADPHYYGIEYDWIAGYFFRDEERHPGASRVDVHYVWSMAWNWDPEIDEKRRRLEKPREIYKGDWVVIGASSYMDTGFHPSINVVSPYKRTQGLQAFRVLGDEKHNRILSVKGENYYGNIGHSLLVFHMKEDLDIYEYLREFYERRRRR